MGDYPSNEAQMILSRIGAMNGEIVIFGAGVAGEAVLNVCRDQGFEAACFCDNNSNKTGRALCGIPVLHTSEIKDRLERPVFLISAADILDVVEQLEGLGFQNWHDCGQILEDFDVDLHPLSVPADFADYVISTCGMCHQAFRNPDALFLRSIDIVITERCSLRCRDCANLMQYYSKPQNYPLEDILESVDGLSSIVDTVNEIRVIGGEPLMSPVFQDVVKKLIDEPKFRKIIIYTNGTICPSEQSLLRLRDPKVLFFITDYGALSRSLERLTSRLDELKIQRFVRAAQGWSRCGSIRWHERDQEQRKTVFGNCCAKHLITLMNGGLYRCPFSANAATLGATPYNPEDSVRIHRESNPGQDARALRRDVLKLLSDRQPLHACDYCEGRPYGAPEIEPAVQAPCPLEYREYPRTGQR